METSTKEVIKLTNSVKLGETNTISIMKASISTYKCFGTIKCKNIGRLNHNSFYV